MDQYFSQHIVRALRNGLIPAHGPSRIPVGREDELRHLRADLELSQNGVAWIRFLSSHDSAG
jgi:hypothetical protein